MGKCKIIAICNEKGGTGKTMTAVSLGAGLAKHGKRVLLVDADSQADLTISLGWRDGDALEATIVEQLAAVIQNEELDPTLGVLRHEEGMDVMPSSKELVGIEMALFDVKRRESVLKRWMEKVSGDYDYIVIDSGRSIGFMMLNVLMAADSVIIPVSADYLSARKIVDVVEDTITMQKKLNPSIRLGGVLVTRFKANTKLCTDLLKQLRDGAGDEYEVFDAVIPASVRAAESPASGKSIFAYDGSSKPAVAYRHFVEEVMAHV